MKDNKKNKAVMGGLMWKLGERVLSQGASFIVSMLLARLLLPSDYGTIALVEVFTDVSYVIFYSGLASALIQNKHSTDADYSTMFFCSFAFALLIYAVLFFIAPWFAVFYDLPILTTVLRVFALQIPLSVYNSIQTAYVSRNGMFRKLFISSSISVIISGGAGILMARMGMGVWSLVVQTMLLTVVNTIVLSILLPWRLRLEFSPESARKMLRYSTQIMGAELSISLFFQLRSLSVGRLYSSTNLAYFQKAQVFPNIVTTNLSQSVIAVMFPTLANLSSDPEQVRQLAKRSSALMCLVMLPVLLGMTAIMHPMVTLLYTEKWIACVPYAQILCIGLAFSVPGIIPMQAMKALGKGNRVLRMELLKKPLYLVLLILGVKHSIMGLAVAMALYELYSALMNMYYMKKYVGSPFLEQLRPFLAALSMSAIMVFCVLLVPEGESLILTVLIKVLVGIAAYVLAFFILRPKSFAHLSEQIRQRLRSLRIEDPEDWEEDVPASEAQAPESRFRDNEMPRIAILLAVYDPHPVWFREQLQSLNAQTYPNLHLYVRDDCSPHVSHEHIRREIASCITAFPFTIRRNDHNVGSNLTFQYLTEDAEGDLFAYCDQDDVWLPEKLEILFRDIQRTGALLACSDLSVIDGQGNLTAHSITQVRKHCIMQSGPDLSEHFLFNNFVFGCASLVDSQAAKASLPFCPHYFHDHYLALWCAEAGSIYADPRQLIRYRIHGSNQTGIMLGVRNKESYCRERIQSVIKRLSWLQTNFPCRESTQAAIRDGLAWSTARLNYWNTGKDPMAMWKYRHVDFIVTFFELFAARLPEWLLMTVIRMLRKNWL